VILELRYSKELKAYPKVRGKAIENQVPELNPDTLKKYMIIPEAKK
jgi:hypothetical protein